MGAALAACTKKGLVSDDSEMKPTGGIAMYEQHTYRVAPGMVTVLDELLYPPGAS